MAENKDRPQSGPLKGPFEWNSNHELVFTRVTDEYVSSLHCCLLERVRPCTQNSRFKLKGGNLGGLYSRKSGVDIKSVLSAATNRYSAR